VTSRMGAAKLKKKGARTFLSNTPRFPKEQFYLKVLRRHLFVLLTIVACNIDECKYGAFVECY
jgi:hypothetical protein